MPATDPNTLLADSGCVTCLGVSIADALGIALWDSISQNIAPVGETFYRISDVGDRRISAVGDARVWQ